MGCCEVCQGTGIEYLVHRGLRALAFLARVAVRQRLLGR